MFVTLLSNLSLSLLAAWFSAAPPEGGDELDPGSPENEDQPAAVLDATLDSLDALDPAASRPTSRPGRLRPVPPRRRPELHRVLWPFDRPPETEREVQWLIDEYRQRVLSDTTVFYLKTTVEKTGTGWRIRGATNDPRMVTAVMNVLARVGCGPVVNEVTPLPAVRLGERRFGVVRAATAMTRAEPTERSGPNTQLLLGEPVFLLDESEDGRYLLVHAGDGYVGWTRQEGVRRLKESEFRAWETASCATLRHDVTAGGAYLPAGCSLPIMGRDAEGGVRLRLPAGPSEPADAAVAVPATAVRLPPESPPGAAVVSLASEYLHVPYVFGARSRSGIDCSGLTGVAYATVGTALPRDARQQVLVGKLVGMPWHLGELRPGDLLFFCDETHRVSHTGISLGGKRFIHASMPEVQISSLDPADPLYSAHWHRRFALARRPLP